ncbi:MAG TPA: nucleotide exchange factor GrpE [Longimicrobium sp.]|nr:nucleotide exchange factor GrpE [Longimicrobium sp.]
MTARAPAFSPRDEIARLTAIDLDGAADDGPPDDGVAGQWDEVTRNLARLGKQQLRINQTVELLETQLAEARERGDEHRREAGRLREQAAATARKLLELVDTLDDVAVLARQIGDPKWLAHLERFITRALRVLEQVGLTEIPALGEAFDAEEHDALDTAERHGDQAPYQVVQVIRRGFRYNGAVLRRAEVITTR